MDASIFVLDFFLSSTGIVHKSEGHEAKPELFDPAGSPPPFLGKGIAVQLFNYPIVYLPINDENRPTKDANPCGKRCILTGNLDEMRLLIQEVPLFLLCIDIQSTGRIILEASVAIPLSIHMLGKGMSLDEDKSGYQTANLPVRGTSVCPRSGMKFSVRLVTVGDKSPVDNINEKTEDAQNKILMLDHAHRMALLRNDIEDACRRATHRKYNLNPGEHLRSRKSNPQGSLGYEHVLDRIRSSGKAEGHNCSFVVPTSLEPVSDSRRSHEKMQDTPATRLQKENRGRMSSRGDMHRQAKCHILHPVTRSKQKTDGPPTRATNSYRPKALHQSKKRQLYRPPPDRCRPLGTRHPGKFSEAGSARRYSKPTYQRHACQQMRRKKQIMLDENISSTSNSEESLCFRTSRTAPKHSPDLGVIKDDPKCLATPNSIGKPSNVSTCAITMWELINLISIRALMSQIVHALGSQMALVVNNTVREFTAELALDINHQSSTSLACQEQSSYHIPKERRANAYEDQAIQTESSILCDAVVQYELGSQRIHDMVKIEDQDISPLRPELDIASDNGISEPNLSLPPDRDCYPNGPGLISDVSEGSTRRGSPSPPAVTIESSPSLKEVGENLYADAGDCLSRMEDMCMNKDKHGFNQDQEICAEIISDKPLKDICGSYSLEASPFPAQANTNIWDKHDSNDDEELSNVMTLEEPHKDFCGTCDTLTSLLSHKSNTDLGDEHEHNQELQFSVAVAAKGRQTDDNESCSVSSSDACSRSNNKMDNGNRSHACHDCDQIQEFPAATQIAKEPDKNECGSWSAGPSHFPSQSGDGSYKHKCSKLPAMMPAIRSLKDDCENWSAASIQYPLQSDKVQETIVTMRSPSGVLLGEINSGISSSSRSSKSKQVPGPSTSSGSQTTETYEEDFEEESATSGVKPVSKQSSEKSNSRSPYDDVDQRVDNSSSSTIRTVDSAFSANLQGVSELLSGGLSVT